MRLGNCTRIVLIGILAGMLAQGAEAARVRPLGLGDMATRAGRIFVGRCVDRTVSEDPATGLPTTTYTFVVTEPIKGVGRGPTTFRVPGTPEQPLFVGMPVSEVGEEALLLLYPESPAGFSVALGLDQGRLPVRRGPSGLPTVSNGRGNSGLFRDIPEGLLRARGLKRDHSGPAHLSAVTELLRDLSGSPGP